MKALTLVALLLLPGVAIAAEPVERTYRFSFPPAVDPGSLWRLIVDVEGTFRAEILPAMATLPPVCAAQHGPCATNADLCTTTSFARTCDGAANGSLSHRGPFTLLGFTGTLATSPSGGWMSDRLVFECPVRLSCLPTNTVEFHCEFAAGTLHVVEVWGSEGGECRFTSWNSLQSGFAFSFHGAQGGDLVGDVWHTVN